MSCLMSGVIISMLLQCCRAYRIFLIVFTICKQWMLWITFGIYFCMSGPWGHFYAFMLFMLMLPVPSALGAVVGSGSRDFTVEVLMSEKDGGFCHSLGAVVSTPPYALWWDCPCSGVSGAVGRGQLLVLTAPDDAVCSLWSSVLTSILVRAWWNLQFWNLWSQLSAETLFARFVIGWGHTMCLLLVVEFVCLLFNCLVFQLCLVVVDLCLWAFSWDSGVFVCTKHVCV